MTFNVRNSVCRATWASRLALSALVIGVGGLGGCFGSKDLDARCDDVSEYQSARSIPLVVVPDGLAMPNRGSGYVVPPPGPNPEVPGAACLARPPAYFKDSATAPPTPEAAK